MAGWKFFHYRYVQKFPLDTLCADWFVPPQTTREYVRAVEFQLAEDYCFCFLDHPPLDGQA